MTEKRAGMTEKKGRRLMEGGGMKERQPPILKEAAVRSVSDSERTVAFGVCYRCSEKGKVSLLDAVASMRSPSVASANMYLVTGMIRMYCV